MKNEIKVKVKVKVKVKEKMIKSVEDDSTVAEVTQNQQQLSECRERM